MQSCYSWYPIPIIISIPLHYLSLNSVHCKIVLYTLFTLNQSQKPYSFTTPSTCNTSMNTWWAPFPTTLMLSAYGIPIPTNPEFRTHLFYPTKRAFVFWRSPISTTKRDLGAHLFVPLHSPGSFLREVLLPKMFPCE
jgi:hypothetical protein